jgi:hypothetical protein
MVESERRDILCAGKAHRHEEKRQHGGAQGLLDGTPHNRQNFHSTAAGFAVALHIVTYEESYPATATLRASALYPLPVSAIPNLLNVNVQLHHHPWPTHSRSEGISAGGERGPAVTRNRNRAIESRAQSAATEAGD